MTIAYIAPFPDSGLKGFYAEIISLSPGSPPPRPHPGPGDPPPLGIWGPGDPRPTLPIAGWDPGTGAWPNPPGERPSGGMPGQLPGSDPGGSGWVYAFVPGYGWMWAQVPPPPASNKPVEPPPA